VGIPRSLLTITAGDNKDPVRITRAKIEREIMELDQEHMKFSKSLQKKKQLSDSEATPRNVWLTKYKDDRKQLVSRLKTSPEPAAS
jgi:hypothetical protein